MIPYKIRGCSQSPLPSSTISSSPPCISIIILHFCPIKKIPYLEILPPFSRYGTFTTLLRRFLLPVLILPTARLPSVYFRSRRKQIRTVGSGTVCQAVHTLLPHGFLRSLFPYLPEPVIWL